MRQRLTEGNHAAALDFAATNRLKVVHPDLTVNAAMTATTDCLTVRLAQTEDDVRAAQHLRYRVFVEELGATGPMVDHEAKIEADHYDPFVDHLLLIDGNKTGHERVVGVYRLLRSDMADAAGGFYSRSEYDLTPLIASGRKLLELGRSCLAADYRGGQGMMLMWNALSDYVVEHGIEVLFGVASFHGTDIERLAPALSLLADRHMAPEGLRVRSQVYQRMTLIEPSQIDRVTAMRDVPPLIKAYLKIGGFVGDGAFVDHAFNTTDVCLILDTERLNASQKALYDRGARR